MTARSTRFIEVSPSRPRISAMLAFLAITLGVGARPSPAAAAGPGTPTIQVSLHNSNHATPSVFPIGTAAHLEVIVRGDGQPIDGDVRIYLYQDTQCQGSLGTVSSVHPLIDGEVDGAAPRRFDTPGSASLTAKFLGNASWAAVDSTCLPVIWKAPVTLTTEVHDASHEPTTRVLVGSPTHMRVSMSGSFGAVQGKINFATYEDGACSGAYTLQGEANTVITTYDVPLAFTPQTTGTYAWRAVFFNSETYLNTAGTCHRLDVVAEPIVSLTFRSPTGAAISEVQSGATYYARAAARGEYGTPSGRGTVLFYGQADCQGSPAATGVALDSGAFDIGPRTAPGPGTLSARFAFNGNATYVAAESECSTLTILPAPQTAQPSQAATSVPSAVPTARPSSAASSEPTIPLATDRPTAPPASGAAPASSGAAESEGHSGIGEPTQGPGVTFDPGSSAEPGSGVAASIGPAAVALPGAGDRPQGSAGAHAPVPPASFSNSGGPTVALLLAVALVALVVGGGTVWLATRRPSRPIR